MRHDLERKVVCVIGLGYVGLPLAEAFATRLEVIGFDIDGSKIIELNQSNDKQNLTFTNNPRELLKADFILICVPTPVTKSKEPDLSYIVKAAKTIGQNTKKGAIVILESTVYPGVTEGILKPIIERESGLKCGQDFKIAYSPERMNPGDGKHTLDKVTKVISGMDEETTELVAKLYLKVTPHIFKAKDIETAEAAKVIENIQRDLNIALMNELSLIFNKMGLSTEDVLKAAATKWNFSQYSPGLVGGHCIPVDPYYLVYKAKEFDYHPQVILAGRAINDYMPKHVAEMAISALNQVGKAIEGRRVLLMGLTYKEDVPDIRESPISKIANELVEYGIEVIGFDPMLRGADFMDAFGIKLLNDLGDIVKSKVDCVILTVAHSPFRKLKLSTLKQIQNSDPVLIDIRGIFSAEEARRAGFYYKTL
ncbi:nucleotide sugar dehydrogenase [Chloroflexota bacterium]